MFIFDPLGFVRMNYLLGNIYGILIHFIFGCLLIFREEYENKDDIIGGKSSSINFPFFFAKVNKFKYSSLIDLL
jgi:hypothetical protein